MLKLQSIVGALLLGACTNAYTPSPELHQKISKAATANTQSGRRNFFFSVAAAFVPVSAIADAPTPETTALNRELLSNNMNPFNSACMGFGCADANGLDFNGAPAPPPGVESISYSDFLKALDNNEVSLVELLPPNGDQAYATLKGSDEPILIGEGWPTERNDGWSSPLFVVRILDNKGVPHKFRFEKPVFKGSSAARTQEKATEPKKVRSSSEFIPNSYTIPSPDSFEKPDWKFVPK